MRMNTRDGFLTKTLAGRADVAARKPETEVRDVSMAKEEQPDNFVPTVIRLAATK